MGMPRVVQEADLATINQIRAELGLPAVDASLNEIGSARSGAPDGVAENVSHEASSETPDEASEMTSGASEPTELSPAEVRDHTESRQIYQAYLKKLEELKPHREYARQVAKATEGRAMTPVRPLATMGANGGPLLCDFCRKPIVLEGGGFNGVTADVAWSRRSSRALNSGESRGDPKADAEWVSYILGGLIVEIQTNGTLRIYHGYPGREKHCCGRASQADKRARAEFDPSERSEKWPMLLAYLEDEFPEMTLRQRADLLNDILDTLFEYDPGLGINRPTVAE